MRTDFREERRWKYAVAFNIATAVLEWHAAGDPETRVAKGICVKWKRPPPPEDVAMGDGDADAVDDQGMEVDDGTRSPSRADGPIVDYGSEEEDDDEIGGGVKVAADGEATSDEEEVEAPAEEVSFPFWCSDD